MQFVFNNLARVNCSQDYGGYRWKAREIQRERESEREKERERVSEQRRERDRE